MIKFTKTVKRKLLNDTFEIESLESGTLKLTVTNEHYKNGKFYTQQCVFTIEAKDLERMLKVLSASTK